MFQKIFIKLGLFIVLYSLYSLGLAVIEKFNFLELVLGFVVLFVLVFFTIYKDWKNKKFKWKKEKRTGIIFLILFVFSFLVAGVFSSENYFGGRDQGVYTNAGIMLAKNSSFEIKSKWADLFHLEEEIQEPTYSLLTPGFKYLSNIDKETGILKTNFYLAYSAYLGIWYKFFGILGIKFANVLPLFITLTSLYFIFKYFIESLPGNCFKFKSDKYKIKDLKKHLRFLSKFAQKNIFEIIFLVLFLSSFAFIYFPKLSLSENFLQFCLWFGIFLFIKFLRNLQKNQIRYEFILGAALCLTLGVLTRIEGLVYLFMFIFIFLLTLIIYFLGEKSKNLIKKNNNSFVFLLVTLLIIIVLSIGVYFYAKKGQKTYAVDLQTYFDMFFSTKAGFEILINTPISEMPGNSIYHNMPEFIFKSLASYGFLMPIFLSVNFIVYCVICILKHYIKNRKFNKNILIILVPFFMALPTINLFWNIYNSLDMPWSLRRYMPILMPLALLYSALLLTIVFKKLESGKIIASLFLIVILCLNLIVSGPYLFYQDNKGLIKQVKQIAQKVESNKDLILVKAGVIPGGDSLISLPLFSLYDVHALHWLPDYTQYKVDDLLVNKNYDYENLYVVIKPDEIDKVKSELHYLSNWQRVYNSNFSLPKLQIYPINAEISVDNYSMYKPSDVVQKQVSLAVYKVKLD